ncbi:hypothetical protein RFI_22379, partial [Reticulomyxa filosa]
PRPVCPKKIKNLQRKILGLKPPRIQNKIKEFVSFVFFIFIFLSNDYLINKCMSLFDFFKIKNYFNLWGKFGGKKSGKIMGKKGGILKKEKKLEMKKKKKIKKRQCEKKKKKDEKD